MTPSNYGERRRNDDEWRSRVEDQLAEHHGYFHGNNQFKGVLWYVNTRIELEADHHRQNSMKLNIIAIFVAILAAAAGWMAVLRTIDGAKHGMFHFPPHITVDSTLPKVEAKEDTPPHTLNEPRY